MPRFAAARIAGNGCRLGACRDLWQFNAMNLIESQIRPLLYNT